MKRILSIAVIAVMTVSTVGCGGKDDGPDKGKETTPKISVKVSEPSVKIEKTATLTISSTKELSEDVVFTITVSGEGEVTAPESLTIESGKKSVTGNVVGIAEGSVKFTISTGSESVIISGSSASLTVEKDAEELPDYPEGDVVVLTFDINEEDTGWFPIYLPNEDEWTETGIMQIGGIWVNTYAWGDASGTSSKRTSLDNYGGRAVGTLNGSAIRLAVLAKDVAINENLAWVENTDRDEEAFGYNTDKSPEWTKAPDIYINGSYTDNAGKSGYVVCEFWYGEDANDIPYDSYRGWIEVSVDANGNVTPGKLGLCLTQEISFKTGQEE